MGQSPLSFTFVMKNLILQTPSLYSEIICNSTYFPWQCVSVKPPKAKGNFLYNHIVSRVHVTESVAIKIMTNEHTRNNNHREERV